MGVNDDVEGRLREAAAKYDDGNGEAEALVEATLRRIAWRKRHGFKICPACQEKKPVTAFGRDSRERDGLYRLCRDCRRLS